MSTQFATGQDYPAYQAEITKGVANHPSLAQFQAAYQARIKARYQALETPGSISSTPTPAMPSVGINVADNDKKLFDKTPERFTL